MEAYFFAFATVLTTLLGGAIGIKFKKHLHLLISFTAGVVLTVALAEVLPELYEISQENGLNIKLYGLFVLAGFFGIHALEKLFSYHDSHEHEYIEHKHPVVGYITALALIGHSFLDGVGIGLGFDLGVREGIIIAVAVLVHDFSDGINTASLMMLNKLNKGKIILILVLDAIAPLVGVFLTNKVNIAPSVVAAYLGIFAGFLLYIGAADLLPEAHSKEKAWKVISLMFAGGLFAYTVTSILGH